jgi:hypothetical protein
MEISVFLIVLLVLPKKIGSVNVVNVNWEENNVADSLAKHALVRKEELLAWLLSFSQPLELLSLWFFLGYNTTFQFSLKKKIIN